MFDRNYFLFLNVHWDLNFNRHYNLLFDNGGIGFRHCEGNYLFNHSVYRNLSSLNHNPWWMLNLLNSGNFSYDLIVNQNLSLDLFRNLIFNVNIPWSLDFKNFFLNHWNFHSPFYFFDFLLDNWLIDNFLYYFFDLDYFFYNPRHRDYFFNNFFNLYNLRHFNELFNDLFNYSWNSDGLLNYSF